MKYLVLITLSLLSFSTLAQTNEEVFYDTISKIKELKTPANLDLILKNTKKVSGEKFLINDFFEITSKAILPLKGIIFRLDPIISSNDFTSHLTASALKTIQFSIPNNIDGLQHFFDYLFIEDKKGSKFQTISEFQRFGQEKILPNLISYSAWLEGLLKQYSSDEVTEILQIDLSKITHHSMNHLPKELRIIKMTTAHLYSLKAHVEKHIFYTYIMGSYNLDELPSFINQTLKSIGKKVFLETPGKKGDLFNANTFTAQEIYEKLQSKKYSKLLTLKSKHFLTESKSWLEKSIKTEQDALKLWNMVKPNPLFKEIYNKNELLLSKLSNDKGIKIISPIDGKSFKLNLAQFFDENNSITQDLKNLFPVKFYTTKERKVENTIVPDFNYGKPMGFKDPSFGGMLPDTTNETVFEKLNAIKFYGDIKLFEFLTLNF